MAVFALVFFAAQALGLMGAPGVAGASEWSRRLAAGFADGNGTSSNPYKIATAEELAFLAAAVNAKSEDTDGSGLYADKHYKLTADIDLGGTLQWTPIGVPVAAGYADLPFAGTFDGDGHVVTGMRIVSDDYKFWQAGLFGKVSGDVAQSAPFIKNLSVTDFVVSVDRKGGLEVGGLVGYFAGDSIHNVLVNGTVSAAANKINSHSHVGGIVGDFAADSTLSSSSASGTVSAIATGDGDEDDAFAGGVVGNLHQNAIITSSYASANASSRSAGGTSGAGGLVGNVGGSAKLDSSYASGSVHSYSSGGSSNAGGLGGKVAGKITNSYATGPVEADAAANSKGAFAGGLIGILEGQDNGHLKTSYAWGAVSADASEARGGLIGKMADAGVTVQSNDWRRDNAPGDINFGLDLGIGSAIKSVDQLTHARSLGVAQFKVASKDHFEKTQGWDFTDTWCYTSLDNGARPHLGVFFGADRNTLSRDIVRITPNAVTISAGETKYVQLTAVGWEKSINSMTFSPPSLNGVGISWGDMASPDVIVLTADGTLSSASEKVSVEFSVNTKPQTASFSLTAKGNTAPPSDDPDDPGRATVTIDGTDVASVTTSGNMLTITRLDDTKTTYNLSENSVTVTYGEKRFTVELNGARELVVTGNGQLMPDGTIVVLTATESGTTQVQSREASLRKGASYALGEAKAAIADGKCVFTFPAEQISKLAAGTYDLTFSTKSGANPAFNGTFASGYVHVKDEPAGPEILLEISETTSGGGVQISATVTSGDAPQAGVAVKFTLTKSSGAFVVDATRTTDATGTVPAFTLDSGLTNGTYIVTASATGYATTWKDVTVTNGEASSGDEEEKGKSGSSGGCDAGAFGLLTLLALGAAIKRRR